MSDLKNIVIIGASNAGHGIATKLSTQLPTTHRVILIDPAPSSFWPIASLRAAVVPGWESKVYHPLEQKNIFPEGSRHTLLRQSVVKLEPNAVVVSGEYEGSSIIPFAALVITTGASQAFPMRPKQEWSAQEVEAQFKIMQQEVAEAKNVLVLGGGPTGIEFAGEIIAHYPGEPKKITLVHRRSALIDERSYSKLSTTLQTKLTNAGVTLILGDEHIAGEGFHTGKQNGTTVVKTKGGKSIEADYIFLAVGNHPNTKLIAEADPAALSSAKLIKVNQFLQVQSKFFNTPNVFTAGDCADSPGWRSFVSAEADTATVAANVIAALKGTALKTHKAGPRVMVVPFGPAGGAGFAEVPFLGDSMLPEFMVPKIKSKELFLSKFHGRFLA